jgi:hypothetical protein
MTEPQTAIAEAEKAQTEYRSAELKSWSLLAARALDDCHSVIETIVAESSSEEEKLDELANRVYNLFNQALCLHGLMTRTQLDKATGFGRVEVTGPIDDPVAPLTPEQVGTLAKCFSTAYTHRTDPNYTAYSFAPHALMDFVQEIEAHCWGGGK